MVWAAGGAVSTSAVNRPLDSSAFLRSGVVVFQSWLFWPSMISARSFSFGLSLLVDLAARVIEGTTNVSIITHKVIARFGRDIMANTLLKKTLCFETTS